MLGHSFIVTEDKLYYLNRVNPSPFENIGVIDLNTISVCKWDKKNDLMIYGNDGDPVARLLILSYKKKKAAILIDLLDSIVSAVANKPSTGKIAESSS